MILHDAVVRSLDRFRQVTHAPSLQYRTATTTAVATSDELGSSAPCGMRRFSQLLRVFDRFLLLRGLRYRSLAFRKISRVAELDDLARDRAFLSIIMV